MNSPRTKHKRLPRIRGSDDEDEFVEVDTLETPDLSDSRQHNNELAMYDRVLRTNPFELKFREANRRSSGTDDSLVGASPAGLNINLPSTMTVNSPGFFSSAHTEALGGVGAPTTADLTRFVSEFVSDAPPPATADILNAVLDIRADHSRAPPPAALASAAAQSSAAGGNGPLTLTLNVNGQALQVPVQVAVVRKTDAKPATTAAAFAAPAGRPITTSFQALADNSVSAASPSRNAISHPDSETLPTAPEYEGKQRNIMERNRAAAVRYRRRKKAEQDVLKDRVAQLEREKLELSTQVTVLRRELERVASDARRRCVCGGAASTNERATSPAVSRGLSYVIQPLTMAAGAHALLLAKPSATAASLVGADRTSQQVDGVVTAPGE